MKPSDRLRQARINAGYGTAKEAANAFGWNRNTYTSHENGNRDISADAARKYADRFRVSLDWLLQGKKGGQHSRPQHLETVNRTIGTIAVSGAVQAGVWQDRSEEINHAIDYLVPASPRYPADVQCAFVIIGESLNKIAKPGSIVVCVDLIKSGVEVEDGDLVIVEYTRYDEQTYQRTAKRIRKTLSGYELWPESTDPRYQTPIAINGTEEHEAYHVTAKVIWIVTEP